MNGNDRVRADNRRRHIGVLVVCLLLATTGRTFAARCGSNPGDAAAIATTRMLIDFECDCATAGSHSDYVQCARLGAYGAVSHGLLPKNCVASVLSCLRKSTCGSPDAVTCCRTNANGTTRASIARSADRCTAPDGGTACVGNYASACDACDASGCVPLPTPTPAAAKPTPTIPGPPDFCKPQIPLPHIARVPFKTTQGSLSCGSPTLSPGASPPFSGHATNAAGQDLTDLGTGCLYTGTLPPAIIPDGGTSILDVVGTSGSALTLGGSPGDGPKDCTLGAGPGQHCSNGKPGTDGFGNCLTDADCGHAVGACNLDANCYFGPPVPVPNGGLSACAITTFLTPLCGTADLSSKQSMLSTALSARLYLTSDPAFPCARCVDGACSGGKNIGKPCTGVGSKQTTIDCPPEDKQFIGTVTVVLPIITTGTSGLTADDMGQFCPDQTSPGAFGNAGARQVIEMGVPLGGSGDLQAQTLAATFCVAATGNAILDGLGHFPAVGALSAPGVLDLSGVASGILPFPIP